MPERDPEQAATRPNAALPDPAGVVIGVLGGTGDQGRGLSRRFAAAGHQVLIGSRDSRRAEAAAKELEAGGATARGGVPGAGGATAAGGVSGAGDVSGAVGVSGAGNEEVAERADVVIAAVPWDGHADLLAALRRPLSGKILVDCVNPIGRDDNGLHAIRPEEGSAAQQAAGLLPDTRVVAAFHHVPAPLLLDADVAEVDCDVLVLGDDRAATDLVIALAGRLPGMRGVYAGGLRHAHQVEALTVNIIATNRRYRTHAGVRITGLPMIMAV